MTVRASTSSGKRISQNEFTEKAWQAIVAAPDIAKQYGQQIVVRRAASRCTVQRHWLAALGATLLPSVTMKMQVQRELLS